MYWWLLFAHFNYKVSIDLKKPDSKVCQIDLELANLQLSGLGHFLWPRGSLIHTPIFSMHLAEMSTQISLQIQSKGEVNGSGVKSVT